MEEITIEERTKMCTCCKKNKTISNFYTKTFRETLQCVACRTPKTSWHTRQRQAMYEERTKP